MLLLLWNMSLVFLVIYSMSCSDQLGISLALLFAIEHVDITFSTKVPFLEVQPFCIGCIHLVNYMTDY